MGRRPPVFDFPSPHLSRVASALREALRGVWPFGRKVERYAALERHSGNFQRKREGSRSTRASSVAGGQLFHSQRVILANRWVCV